VTHGAGAAAGPAARWRWRHVLASPHRVGFLCGMTVLVASGAWWALVQLDRAGMGPQLALALPSALAHGAVMVLGFMPLFFAGFLFTVAPRWLAVPAPPATAVVAPLAAQAAGWLLWLLAAPRSQALALAGLLLALAGLLTVTWRLGRMVAASRQDDRLHARAMLAAHVAGCACLAALAGCVAAGALDAARAAVRTGLWCFIVPVFLAAADRQIPFFSPAALPGARWPCARHSLQVLLALAALEALGAWLAVVAPAGPWQVALGMVEALAAGVVLALAVAWLRARRLATRLMVMFHAALLWLGLSFGLAAAGHLLGALQRSAVLPLAALHALAMGCLGSLMLGMVSRVAAGQAGRSQVTDGGLWLLFWLLQGATLLRVAATVRPAQGLLTIAAVLWAVIALSWGARQVNGYGRPRLQRGRRTIDP
jgi:uncharacterized protein involved in response to NO